MKSKLTHKPSFAFLHLCTLFSVIYVFFRRSDACLVSISFPFCRSDSSLFSLFRRHIYMPPVLLRQRDNGAFTLSYDLGSFDLPLCFVRSSSPHAE